MAFICITAHQHSGPPAGLTQPGLTTQPPHHTCHFQSGNAAKGWIRHQQDRHPHNQLRRNNSAPPPARQGTPDHTRPHRRAEIVASFNPARAPCASSSL